VGHAKIFTDGARSMQAVRLPAHRKAAADHGADRRRSCRHRQRVLDAGENKFLSKPVQPDDIHALPIARYGARALGRRVGWADFDDAALAALSPAEPPTSDTPAPSTVNAQTPQPPDSATSATTASAAGTAVKTISSRMPRKSPSTWQAMGSAAVTRTQGRSSSRIRFGPLIAAFRASILLRCGEI
jgi:cell division septation protein DedD